MMSLRSERLGLYLGPEVSRAPFLFGIGLAGILVASFAETVSEAGRIACATDTRLAR